MDPNPYESPERPDQSTKVPARRQGVVIALGVLAIPAGAIAFFTTCVATLEVAPGSGDELPLLMGVVGGAATIALMIFLMVLASKR
ncbi:hypothetical protein ETAA8_68750 [Anatilimnocola aggregata]|uniref:Uncharacterized protein n=1 Tax=Anatilimnocola aggregata TaxID=2528021 RepID=A0A517YNC1_9BACT|nr:hypothetical protein [Anatilimnocola aggregata]QDU31715.1 hypothetical protein ETAA8_68750 [Anatilimnocola aggregata]